MDKIINAGDFVGNEVDAPETITRINSTWFVDEDWYLRNLPGVAVAGREAHEAVGEGVVVHKRAQLATKVRRSTHSTIPVADNCLSNQSREVQLIAPAHTLNGNSNVGGGHGVVTDTDFRTNKIRFLLLRTCNGLSVGSRRCGGDLGKVFLCELDKLLMGDSTGTDKDHTVSCVVGLNVLDEVVTGNALNVLFRSKDGAA